MVPTVTLGGYYAQDGTFGVLPDYTAGVLEAATALYENGHRRLAVLCEHPAGPEGMITFMDMVKSGVMQAYEAHADKAEPPAFHRVAGMPSTGYERGRELFSDDTDRPDAVISSDGAMIGLYRAAAERGLSIPGDISFIGMDGTSEGPFLTPSLTTCDAHIAELGARAVSILTEMVRSGKRRRGMEVLPMTFRRRASARI
jgi:LacI family transcriptional regulator